eukprot:g2311.t1
MGAGVNGFEEPIIWEDSQQPTGPAPGMAGAFGAGFHGMGIGRGFGVGDARGFGRNFDAVIEDVDRDHPREYRSTETTFHHRKECLHLYRSESTLETYQAFLMPFLDDSTINLVEHYAIENRRLEVGISNDEHELVLIRCGWSMARYFKSMDEDTRAHMRETGQFDEMGAFLSVQTWSTRFAGAKADNRNEWYQNMLKSILVDGVIDQAERKLIRNVRLSNGISTAEHKDAMLAEGVTPEQEMELAGESRLKSPARAIGTGGQVIGGRTRARSTTASVDDEKDSLFTMTIAFGNKTADGRCQHKLQKQSYFRGAHRAIRVAVVKTPQSSEGGVDALNDKEYLRGKMRKTGDEKFYSSFKTVRDTEPVPEGVLDYDKHTVAFGRTIAVSGRSPEFEQFELPFPILRRTLKHISLVVQLVLVHQGKKAGHVTVLGQRVFSRLDEYVKAPTMGTVWGEQHTGNPVSMKMMTFAEQRDTAPDSVCMSIKLTTLTFKELHARAFSGIPTEMQSQIVAAYHQGAADEVEARVEKILNDVKSFHEQLYHVVLKLIEDGLFDEKESDMRGVRPAEHGRRLLLRLDSSLSASSSSREVQGRAQGTGLELFRRYVT